MGNTLVNHYVSVICDRCKQPKQSRWQIELNKRFVVEKGEDFYRPYYIGQRRYYLCDNCLKEFAQWIG